MLNIDELIKNALKSGNKIELKAYRNLKSKKIEFETAVGAKPYNIVAELGIIKKMIKQLKDSENIYFNAGRQDLVSECTVEREVLEKLLPQPVNEQILKCELGVYYKSDPITGEIKIPKSEMSKAISILKNKFPANEGKEIANLVKQYII